MRTQALNNTRQNLVWIKEVDKVAKLPFFSNKKVSYKNRQFKNTEVFGINAETHRNEIRNSKTPIL